MIINVQIVNQRRMSRKFSKHWMISDGPSCKNQRWTDGHGLMDISASNISILVLKFAEICFGLGCQLLALLTKLSS